MNQQDHDLLIELNVLVKQLADALHRIEISLKDKAAKADLDQLTAKVVENTGRIASLEVSVRKQETEENTLLKFGKFSMNAWQFFIGLVVSGLTIWQIINALKK